MSPPPFFQKPHPLVSSKFQQYLKTGEGMQPDFLKKQFLFENELMQAR